MDVATIKDYIAKSFEKVDVVDANGDSFFFYEPGDAPPDHRIPFATIVTGDRYDKASALERPNMFRLNLGVKKETYVGLFGSPPSSLPREDGTVNTGHDFTQLDTIMPHPVSATMGWVCVLSPSDKTFAAVKPLLAEAYEVAKGRRG